MSASDSRAIDFTASSRAPAPDAALRETLSQLMRQLLEAGVAPFHLTAMTWTAPDIAALHPRRHAVDRLYREIFGGFQPPIKLVAGEAGALSVSARAVLPALDKAPEPVWHGFRALDLARQYSPRNQVPDMGALFNRWSVDGAAARSAHGGLDIAYGPSVYETFDLYRAPRAERTPLWVFIHGGYWQASDKDQHAQFMAGMLRSGYAVANLNYGLCPDVTLEDITGQIRAALSLLVHEADSFGFDPAQIHIAGHSAGGHLAAMAAADPDGPAVQSALLLSGLFELTPLSLLPFGRLLGLSDGNAIEQMSPIRRRPRPGMRVGVAVGGLESDEFKWQSSEITKAWGAPAVQIVAGANHFSLLDGLNEGQLLDFARKTAGV